MEVTDIQEMAEEELRESQEFDNEAYKFAKLLITDDRLADDEELMKKFWIVFDKDVSLSNLTEEDVKSLLLWFDILKIDYLMSKYEDEIDFRKIRNIDALRAKLLVKAKRSTGGLTRDRALFAQQHQIKELVVGSKEAPKGGILGRIASLFGGR